MPYVNDGILVPEAFPELPDSSPTAFTNTVETGKEHNEEDIAVLNSHLTRSNLLFVRQFTYQNKGNLFLFSILAVHFQFALAKKKYRPTSLARSFFDHKRLVISTKPLEKKVKRTREKLKF